MWYLFHQNLEVRAVVYASIRMSSERQGVRDLIEEGKKRIVLLFVCIVGLSYLMSLTSSSVWANLPIAASLIILLRYISYDLEMQRKSDCYKKDLLVNEPSAKVPLKSPKYPSEADWRNKVNSPLVEAAIDQLSQHLVSEWITDLWYSRLTPDREGPEELLQIINAVFGEISVRVRDINLINLFTRDIINLICSNLELYRACEVKIGHDTTQLSFEQRDTLLKQVLISEGKLHPALVSAEAEYKVLQHLMDGLISLLFRPADLHCFFFRCAVRELFACAVMRPFLRLANPRFINERIEILVLSLSIKTEKGDLPSGQNASQTKASSISTASDKFSLFWDRSNKGLELIQLKPTLDSVSNEVKKSVNLENSGALSKESSCLPVGCHEKLQARRTGGEWAQMLDALSSQKLHMLTPEHFDNLWAKGKNYKKRECKTEHRNVYRNSLGAALAKKLIGQTESDASQRHRFSQVQAQHGKERGYAQNFDAQNTVQSSSLSSSKNEKDSSNSDEVWDESESSYSSEDDETGNITGLDSPCTRVWDSKNNRHTMNSIVHHPLENQERHTRGKGRKGQFPRNQLAENHLGRKKFRLRKFQVPIWQEVERTTLEDGLDILTASNNMMQTEDSNNEAEVNDERIYSGTAASTSGLSISAAEACSQSVSSEYAPVMSSFLRLRCEVLGADIVKSGSSMFAVYSVSVIDENNNSWSIKRRFRHFEELHRHLKEFPTYNLHLPPKHYLSSGLDVSIVQERCKLLDSYLKELLQLPTVSDSLEVWDFLSVDSQIYRFSNSLSIVETLSVDLDEKKNGKRMDSQSFMPRLEDHLLLRAINSTQTQGNDGPAEQENNAPLGVKGFWSLPIKIHLKKSENELAKSEGDLHQLVSAFAKSTGGRCPGYDGQTGASASQVETATEPSLPTEWVPPSLSVPIFDLVDVLFQLQDGGWIRRKVFWVAKQVLQLGMGDAFDDWLIEKIQLLRKGSVIALIIQRIEQILWPDGLFITKHPKHQPAPAAVGQQGDSVSELKEKDPCEEENSRRARFVREIMIDNAPAALVSLVGRKEYERSMQDVYFFLQSSICLKQLMLELLELLLLSAFPELDQVVKECHEEEQFRDFNQ